MAKATPFLKGNQYYKLRTKDGRDRIFKTPEELADACNKYFEWIEANPFEEDNLFAFQGKVTHEPAKKMRTMSLEGLCNFLDIHVDTWKLYAERPDFIGVTKKARQIIDVFQFEGATANLLNPNIIARKLGLTERTDVTTKGNEIKGTFDYSKLDKETLQKLTDAINE